MRVSRIFVLTLSLCLMLGGVPSDLEGIETFDAGAKDPPCPATNTSSLQSGITLDPQTCLSVNLGQRAPGEVISFEFDISGQAVDVLVFAANSVDVYLNSQSYRSDNVWEGDTSIESLNGSAEWHWEVPDDRAETVWFLIIDNLAHPGDSGEGAQGNSTSDVDLTISTPNTSYWALTDSLQVLAPGSNMALLGPDHLTLDAGTQVSITAIPLSGVGDLFILTESQKDTYLMGGGGAFWVPGTELLSIDSPTTKPWIVTSDLAGEPLYLFIDNEAGPSGGGDGASELRLTVSVSLLPVLNPTISSSDDLNSVDVGEEVIIEVSSTPNLSNQASLTQTTWDFDEDSSIDATGESVTTTFSTPGSHTVWATLLGVDGRTSSDFVVVEVSDQTNPSASILGSSVWQRDVDANFTLTSTSTDNWQISREEWRVDGLLIASFTQTGSSFTHSINTTGNHTVELTVVDGADNVDTAVVTIQVRDGTKPVVGDIQGVTATMTGESVTFTVTASDPESQSLNYSWDFDKEVDSNGDSITYNDDQAQGQQVTWSFTSAKPTYVVCTVTNDAGLTKSVEFLIDVEGVASSASSSGMPSPATILAVLVILVALGIAGWRGYVWRQESLAAEAFALQQAAAAAEEEEQEDIDPESQKAMFSRSGSYGDSIESLAGASYAPSGQVMSGDALAAFVDDETEPAQVATSKSVASEDEDVMDDLDFLKSREEKDPPASEPVVESASEPVAQSGGKTAKRSSGIMLPGQVSQTATKTSEIQVNETPTSEPVPAPVTESGVTTVKASCPACSQMFAVDMPDNLEEALVACPKCEKKIRLER